MATNVQERDEAPEDAATSPSSSAPLLFGSGQAAWLAVLTLAAGLALALSITAIVLATDDDGGGTVVADAGPAASLSVAMSEFAFDPDSASVAEGAEVTVTNDGAVEHNWTVLSEPIEASDELAEVEELVGLTAASGETVSTTLDLAPGTYQVICTIAGHLEAGMTGELTVS